MKLADCFAASIDEVLSAFDGFRLTADDGAGHGEDPAYLRRHRHEYIRTLQDVVSFFAGRESVRIFEIGAFFGVVSIALARRGYRVTASDIPEYMSIPAQQERFRREGVEIHPMRLQDFVIEAPSESFDCVIMCEVLEHLNFNPLPLLKEINRIIRPNGLFYLALPNQAQIRNRLRLLRGQAVGIAVERFFEQLDPTQPVIIDDHWREYTAADVRGMLEPLGFALRRQYFFGLAECQADPRLRKRLGRLFYRAFPSFKENQTNLAVKVARTPIEFHIPPTVHPTLRRI